MQLRRFFSGLILAALALTGCNNQPITDSGQAKDSIIKSKDIEERVAEYISVKLDCDISKLSSKEKAMIPLLIEAAEIIDNIYWKQTWGDKEALLKTIPDGDTLQFVMINYGPWSRLENNEAFIDRFGMKPPGAGFYPPKMTVTDFMIMTGFEDKYSMYTLIRKNEQGDLYTARLS